VAAATAGQGGEAYSVCEKGAAAAAVSDSVGCHYKKVGRAAEGAVNAHGRHDLVLQLVCRQLHCQIVRHRPDSHSLSHDYGYDKAVSQTRSH
jgi:hypothetical protein